MTGGYGLWTLTLYSSRPGFNEARRQLHPTLRKPRVARCLRPPSYVAKRAQSEEGKRDAMRGANSAKLLRVPAKKGWNDVRSRLELVRQDARASQHRNPKHVGTVPSCLGHAAAEYGSTHSRG